MHAAVPSPPHSFGCPPAAGPGHRAACACSSAVAASLLLMSSHCWPWPPCCVCMQQCRRRLTPYDVLPLLALATVLRMYAAVPSPPHSFGCPPAAGPGHRAAYACSSAVATSLLRMSSRCWPWPPCCVCMQQCRRHLTPSDVLPLLALATVLRMHAAVPSPPHSFGCPPPAGPGHRAACAYSSAVA